MSVTFNVCLKTFSNLIWHKRCFSKSSFKFLLSLCRFTYNFFFWNIFSKLCWIRTLPYFFLLCINFLRFWSSVYYFAINCQFNIRYNFFCNFLCLFIKCSQIKSQIFEYTVWDWLRWSVFMFMCLSWVLRIKSCYAVIRLFAIRFVNKCFDVCLSHKIWNKIIKSCFAYSWHTCNFVFTWRQFHNERIITFIPFRCVYNSFLEFFCQCFWITMNWVAWKFNVYSCQVYTLYIIVFCCKFWFWIFCLHSWTQSVCFFLTAFNFGKTNFCDQFLTSNFIFSKFFQKEIFFWHVVIIWQNLACCSQFSLVISLHKFLLFTWIFLWTFCSFSQCSFGLQSITFCFWFFYNGGSCKCNSSWCNNTNTNHC